MKKSPFVALPPDHIAASRLAHRVARAIIARDKGWSLDGLAISRRWRIQIGSSRWIAQAFVTLRFNDLRNVSGGGRAVFAISFKGKGTSSELLGSKPVQDVHARLGVYRWWHRGRSSIGPPRRRAP